MLGAGGRDRAASESQLWQETQPTGFSVLSTVTTRTVWP